MLQFTIPGEPRGKGRPRFGKTRAGAAITFTDAKTAGYEALVALAAHNAMAGRAPIPDPVCVSIVIRLTPPASYSGKRRLAMLSGEVPILGRFDIDNQAKAVLDGCNKVAFADDRQIVRLVVCKVASETPGVDVTVTPYLSPVARAEAA